MRTSKKRESLATRVPGRMEVLTQKNGAKVFIDYAHNGDSLKKLINVVETHQTGKIALVLGSTGNKGESRPERTLASSSINILRFKSF